ncbi:MAG: ATP-binding protein [Polyangiaceae bacterium]
MTRDLTERRAAEENERRLVREQLARAVSEAERQRLLVALQQVPAMINFLRGPDLVIEVAHPKLREAAGGREILGRPLLTAFPDLRDSPFHARLLAVYERAAPSEAQEQPPWLGDAGDHGDSYWNSVYLPVCDAASKVVGVVTFDLDVTESVRVRRELERADRAKDSFLATMSHELRTPLNALLGWVQILRMDASDPKRLAHGLEVVERNARAQQRIVDDLLDVSRIASGKLQLTLRPTDVGAVVRAAAEVIRPAAEAKGVRLAVEVEENLGAGTLADPDRLQQVVWNLLSNAVRYTPRDGDVRVNVTRTGSDLRIAVADTGAGIPPGQVSHVFERFHQVDGATARRAGGLGLGLAIVRHLAEAHGGTVAVSSAGEGQGSTFSVELPIRTVDVPARGVEAPPLAGFHVWLVDDDADSLDLVAASLRAAGAAVTTFPNATAVLAAEGGCDLLVSDIGLPDTDGYKLLQTLRARDGIAFPAIALTGFEGPLDTQRAVLAGFQHYLTKPIQRAALVDAVRQWCRRD